MGQAIKEDSANTRDRVLDAASTLFAEKGFRATTVAEICELAEANIAAVNYYFASKRNLYREAWRHAHFSMLEVFPPDGGVTPDAKPAERLRGRIRGLLQRATAGDGREFRIMSHEMNNPTGLLAQVLKDSLSPLRQAMREIITALLGGRADEKTVEWCELCVVSPCLQLVHRRHIRRHQPENKPFVPSEEDLEDLVEHMTAFALAGIRKISRQGRAGRANDGRKRKSFKSQKAKS